MNWKLCYVYDQWAYFTKLSLKKQSGDDWDDKPFEYNSEPPIEDAPGQILKVAYDGELHVAATMWWTNKAGLGDDGVSVDDVNLRQVCPWLATDEYADKYVEVMAGATLYDFTKAVEETHGQVYRAR